MTTATAAQPVRISTYRVRLIDVAAGDVIPGLGEVVSNEPNGRNRLLTFTDGSTYNQRYRKMERIQRSNR